MEKVKNGYPHTVEALLKAAECNLSELQWRKAVEFFALAASEDEMKRLERLLGNIKCKESA